MITHDGIIRPRRIHGWTSSSDTQSTFSTSNRQIPGGGGGGGGGGGAVFNIGNDYKNPSLPLYLGFNDNIKNNKFPKKKKINIRKSIINQLQKYCENTTLHGLRYVGDPHLTFGERLFWFVSFISAITFAAYYITNIYAKWNSSPVIISFSPFDVDLNAIPFPAVTICNMNQAKKIEAERILESGSRAEKKLLDEECDLNSTVDNSEQITGEELRDFLIKVGSSCDDILHSCFWGSSKIDCNDFFNNYLTDEGLCCAFNRLPSDKIMRNAKDSSILNQTYPQNIYDWTPEKRFSEKRPEEEFPKQPLGAGINLGLSLILNADVDNYYCSSTRSYGFKVLFSNPVEAPKIKDYGFLLTPGTEARIAIQPQLREATDSLRNIPIEQRQCYFSNERPLEYYRSYTQFNCLQECQSNFILKNCDCIPYYLPRNKSIPFCGKNRDKCVDKAKEEIEYTGRQGESCRCHTSCFLMRYSNTISLATILPDKVQQEVTNRTFEYIRKNIVVAHFYFPNSKFTKEMKSELYGVTEILSNVGGLLGLCLGFSFLSLVELFYFLSLRLVCHWCKYNAKMKEKRDPEPPMYPFVK